MSDPEFFRARTRWNSTGVGNWVIVVLIFLASIFVWRKADFKTAFSPEEAALPPQKHWLDFLAALLVALGFLASAWSAFNGTRQLKQSEETTKRQLRAYVLLEGEPQIQFDKTSFVIAVKVKNGGATPAYNLTRSTHAQIIREEEIGDTRKPEFAERYVFETERLPTTDLSAGRLFEWMNNFELSASDFADVRNGAKIIFVSIDLKYRDTFGRCQTVLIFLKISPIKQSQSWEVIDYLNAASDPDAACDDDQEGYGKRSRPSVSGWQ